MPRRSRSSGGVINGDCRSGKSVACSDQTTVVDMLAAENSKLHAKIKTICRGCWRLKSHANGEMLCSEAIRRLVEFGLRAKK